LPLARPGPDRLPVFGAAVEAPSGPRVKEYCSERSRVTLCTPSSVRATKNKGSKILVIPITEELHPILAEWIRANPGKGYDPLIRRSNGQQFTRSAVERWARAWGEEAGVSACHPHRFRHTLATELLRRGVRLEVLQRLLGHVSITTTQAYTRLSDAEVIRALKVPLR